MTFKDFEDARLRIYLRKCDRIVSKIKSIDLKTREEVIREIEHRLLHLTSDGRSLSKVLSLNSDYVGFTNQVLIDKCLPLYKKSGFAIFLKVMSVIVIVTAIVIYLAFKAISNSINWVAENVEFDFDVSCPQNKHTGSASSIKKVFIDGDSGVLNFYSSDDGNFSYSCETCRANFRPLRVEGDNAKFTIEGTAKCDVYLPRFAPSVITLNSGVIAIKNAHQNLKIGLNKGVVSFNRELEKKYRLVKDVKGVSIKTQDFNPKGTFTFDVLVKQGVLKAE